MKKILAVAFCFLPIAIFAQAPRATNEIGYYFDINKQLIPGYVDFDYKVNNPFSVSCKIGENFTPGCYYDLQNVKHVGLIKVLGTSGKIRFKQTTNGEAETISATESNAFVLGRDSFIVFSRKEQDFNMDDMDLSELKSFVLVLERVGNVTFCRQIVADNLSNQMVYMAKADGDSIFDVFPNGKAKFIPIARKFFAFSPYYNQKIESGVFTSGDVPSLIKLLKYHNCYANQAKIFFSKSWDEVVSVSEADKYTIVEDIISDTILVVKQFFLDGTPISKQYVVSLLPFKAIGISEYYFPDGTIRKLKYPFGKKTMLTYCYDSGSPFCDIVSDGRIPFYLKMEQFPFSNIPDSKPVYSWRYNPRTGSMEYSQSSGVVDPFNLSNTDELVDRHIEIQNQQNGIDPLKRKWFFRNVYDASGKNVLDSLGNGSVVFFDKLNNRELHYEFSENQIDLAYYFDANQRKVYQVCERNAKYLDGKYELLEKLKTNLHYQEYSFDSDAHGIALIRCVVEPTGLVSEFELIREVSSEYKSPIENFFTQAKYYQCFTPAVVGKEKVAQEVVMPMVFELKSNIPSYNYYNNNWMFHNQMMMQNQMMMKPPMPTGFPR